VSDLDKAFQAFFRRIKAGETPGYPRFKSYKRWDSFGFKEYGNGFKLDGRRLKISGVGQIRVRWHRPYEGKIKTCRIVCKADGWYASFTCEVTDPQPLPETGKAVGIDVGLAHLLTTSAREHTENPRWYREAQRKLRLKQRELARSKKGGKNRRKRVNEVQRLHLKVKRQRKDYIDKVVDYLVQQYDLIAIEDLKPTNMVRNKHLSKSILDAGWGYFRERLNTKAVDAGWTVIAVNPAYTSQTCSACGCVNHENRPDQAAFCCIACGHSNNADVNAAKNILNLTLNGRDASVLHNVGCS
ncbi:MAG: RNA-guided endonuclease InsQ/TnpB family protein, partial [Chloroflexota bacterium]